MAAGTATSTPGDQFILPSDQLIPLRALALYAKTSGERRVWLVAERAADIFLKRVVQTRGKTLMVIFVSYYRATGITTSCLG
jgi:hypothetical protein